MRYQMTFSDAMSIYPKNNDINTTDAQTAREALALLLRARQLGDGENFEKVEKIVFSN